MEELKQALVNSVNNLFRAMDDNFSSEYIQGACTDVNEALLQISDNYKQLETGKIIKMF